MSKINLDYINAEYLTRLLSEPLTKQSVEYIMDEIQGLIQDDLSRAQGYIEKYDNQWDRAEGTDVAPLKKEVSQIEINLVVLKDLLNESFQDVKKS